MTKVSLSNESRFIKFSVFLVFVTLSMISAIYIVYNVVRFASIRRRFHNQTLIILVSLVLFNTIFNIPTTMSFYARGRALIEHDSFCHAWEIIDYIFTASIIWCNAIFTLERYILIFHSNRLRSQQQRLLLHHIPLVLINLYLILFYILVHIFCPENYPSHFDRLQCGDQCMDYPYRVSRFNWLFNILFPAFIVIFGSIGLLLRVLWTRREMQQNLRNWSKNLKMIVQLLGIAIIYTIIWLPLAIISLISMFQKDDTAIEPIVDHFEFLSYLCEMIVPIVALYFWPELMRKLRRCLRSISIVPITLNTHPTHQPNGS